MSPARRQEADKRDAALAVRGHLQLGDRAVPLVVRRHPRARQIILRVDGIAERAVITLPRRVPVREGLDLARRKSAWIRRQLDALPPRIPFVEGAVVPLMGVAHRLRWVERGAPPVSAEDGALLVAGRAEHRERRLRDWLKRRARHELATRSRRLAAAIGREVAAVSVRDTRSRWGSCAPDGRLSFCWRLILAPEWVLDYVVAHEVAHLVYRGHGPRFWKLVGTLTGEADRARAWLNRHGAALHRYG